MKVTPAHRKMAEARRTEEEQAKTEMVKELGEKAAHEAVERAEREQPPSDSEFNRTPPGFERD